MFSAPRVRTCKVDPVWLTHKPALGPPTGEHGFRHAGVGAGVGVGRPGVRTAVGTGGHWQVLPGHVPTLLHGEPALLPFTHNFCATNDAVVGQVVPILLASPAVHIPTPAQRVRMAVLDRVVPHSSTHVPPLPHWLLTKQDLPGAVPPLHVLRKVQSWPALGPPQHCAPVNVKVSVVSLVQFTAQPSPPNGVHTPLPQSTPPGTVAGWPAGHFCPSFGPPTQ